jgi:hypothetical protein
MADLITIYEYKDSQNITGVKDDSRITSLVASVSQLIKTYTGNSFVDYFSTARTEYFNIDYDTHVVQLEQSPIVSVTSVHERSSQADAYVLLEKDGSNGKYDYHIDTDTDSIFRTTDETYKNWTRNDYYLLLLIATVKFGDAIETYLPSVITQVVSCEMELSPIKEGFLGVVFYFTNGLAFGVAAWLSEK